MGEKKNPNIKSYPQRSVFDKAISTLKQDDITGQLR